MGSNEIGKPHSDKKKNWQWLGLNLRPLGWKATTLTSEYHQGLNNWILKVINWRLSNSKRPFDRNRNNSFHYFINKHNNLLGIKVFKIRSISVKWLYRTDFGYIADITFNCLQLWQERLCPIGGLRHRPGHLRRQLRRHRRRRDHHLCQSEWINRWLGESLGL